MDQPTAKKKKEIRLRLSHEQSSAFHKLTNHKHKHITRVLYGGQAGGGKSFIIALWLDFMAKEYPGTRYYMARERLKDIKESILLTFWDVIKLTGSKVRYNDKESSITYSNKSKIYLVDCFAYPSDPNFDSLGSREYTAGAIEEGITVVKRVADILISRTRYKHDQCWRCNGTGVDKKTQTVCVRCDGEGKLKGAEKMAKYGLSPKQLITCNPGDGWIKDDIVLPTLEHGKPKRLSDIFIRATLESNPNVEFRNAYIKTLSENLSTFDKARLLHGDWNARPKSGAEFLREWNSEKHVDLCEYDPEIALHISFDENVHPYITCLIFQIQTRLDKKEVRQIDEVCLHPPINSRKHVCREIISRYSGHRGGVFIYGDATSRKNETGKEYGENFFSEITGYLKQFRPASRVPLKNPPVVSKGGFINRILESEYEAIKIIVHPKCRLSQSDYAFTLEDSDGTILKKRQQDPLTGISMEKYGHHVDAFSYFMCYAFSGEFDKYLSGGESFEYESGLDRDYEFHR